MLKKLTLEAVRGKSGEFVLGKLTRLLGRNETGKSTVKEAICFLFAGTDSSGMRSPTHLISNDQDGLKIEGETDKATISRTLTRKGSQSLSIVRNGVRTPCSQEQLSRALGASPDLFLSTFLPGYFMSMTEEKRQAVLNEVLPAIDRLALLSQILGSAPIEDDLILLGDLARRPDRIAEGVSRSRRAALQQLNQLQGEVKALKQAAEAMGLTAPVLDETLTQQLEDMRALGRSWSDYRARKTVWDRDKAELDRIKSWNAALAPSRKAKEEGIAMVERQAAHPVPDLVDHSAKRTALFAEQLNRPAKPALLNLPEGDRCPCCGQIVGVKHREQVREEAGRVMAEYRTELARVTANNERVAAELARLNDEERASAAARREAEQLNQQRHTLLNKAKSELAKLEDKDLPNPGPEPEQPPLLYDLAEEKRIDALLSQHSRAMGAYEQARHQRQEAGYKLNEANRHLAPLEACVTRLELIEKALVKLPGEELQARSAQLSINGYTFSLEGTTVTRADGIPYRQLSTGAGIKADIMLSWKLQTLMGLKSPGLMFVDDAELMDTEPSLAAQLLLAYVMPEMETLTLEVEGA